MSSVSSNGGGRTPKRLSRWKQPLSIISDWGKLSNKIEGHEDERGMGYADALEQEFMAELFPDFPPARHLFSSRSMTTLSILMAGSARPRGAIGRSNHQELTIILMLQQFVTASSSGFIRPMRTYGSLLAVTRKEPISTGLRRQTKLRRFS